MADSKLMDNVCEHETYPRKYPLPLFVCKFPAKRNDFHDSPLNEEWMQWVFNLSGMDNQVFRKKAEGLSVFIHLFFPFCNKVERMESLVKTFVASFLMDDYLEKSYAQITDPKSKELSEPFKVVEVFHKLKNKGFVSMAKWSPYFYGLYSPLEETYNTYDDFQRQRAADQWLFCFEGYYLERDFRKSGRKHKSLDDYNKIRIRTSGARVCFQSVEFADSIYVPEHVWNDPRMETLSDLANLYISYTNDIFSFEKEFNESQDLNKMFNAVAVIAVVEGLSIHQSMERVVELITNKGRDFLQLEEEIINEENCLPVTKTLIHGIKYMIGGNFEYSRVTDRYNKDLIVD